MKSISTLFRQLFLIVVLISTFSLSAWGETTVEMTTFSATSVSMDNVISYSTAKGGSTSNPAIYSGEIRLYQNSAGTGGGYITITAKENYTISSVTIGSSMATSVAHIIGSSTTKSNTSSLAKNGKHTISDINNQSVTIYCMGKDKNSRLYVNYLSVTYTDNNSDPETPCTDPEILFASNEITKINGDDPFTKTLTTNSSGEVTYTSSATNVATVDNNGKVTINGVGTTTITATVAADGTYCEAEASYTLTVNGRKFNITWMNGAETHTTTTYTEGGTLEFPVAPTSSEACQNAGWEFAGWSTSEITEDVTSATLLTGTYTPTSDIKLYAVYKLGEDEEPISITAKTTSEGWNVNETNKSTKYWGLFNGNYITTPEISLDNIKSIVVSMGTYGGVEGKTLQIINNSTSGVIATEDATNNSEDTKYTIYSFNGKNGNAKLKFQSNTTSTSIGLRIKSITINFNGAIYNSAPICAEKETLVTPTLTSSNVDKRGFVISWESIENADQYDVTISNSAEEIVKETITETSYTATDLTPGTEYVCKVKAINSAGDFYDSEEVSLTIKTATPSTYTITWNTNGTEKTTEYTEGQALELSTPTIESTDYCNFAGWYTEPTHVSNLNPSQAPTGEKVTSATKPTGNVTYYAVYDNSKPEEKVTYNLTDGTYYIRTEDGIYYTGKNTEKNIGDYSSSIEDAAEIIITTSGSNFAIFDGTYWLSSPNKNEIIFNNKLTTDWTLTNEGQINSITQTTRFLQYNKTSGQERFACYTNTQEKVYLYRKGNPATGYFSKIISEKEVNNKETFEHATKLTSLTIYADLNTTGEIVANADINVDVVTLIKTIDSTRWFFFSLPFDCNISDIVAIGANGDTLTYAPNETDGDYVIAKYNGGWEELLGDNKPTLNANQGYIIGHWYKSSTNVTVKFPSNGAQNISAPANATLAKTSVNRFNLIGLPYFQKVTNVGLNTTHVSIPNEDGTYTQELCNAEIIASIAPFTSFFVQTEDENIKFTLGAQQNAAPMLRANGVTNKAVITLTDANGGADKTTIINNPSKTTDYEIGHDLTKLIGYASIPQIYSLQGDEMLAFNSLAIDNSTVIPLGVYAHTDGDYTFRLSEKSVGDLEGWELYDNETGKTTRLANEDLTICLEQGTHEGRFEIRLQQRITTNCDNSMGDMTTWTANGTLNINNLPADAVVYIYDAVGRMIYVANNNSTAFNYTFAARGVYNIVVRSADNTVSFKTIY